MKKKSLIVLLSLLCVVMGAIAVFAAGIYQLGWDNAATRAFASAVPLPAAAVNGRIITLGELDARTNQNFRFSRAQALRELVDERLRVREAAVAALSDKNSDGYRRAEQALRDVQTGMDFSAAAEKYSDDEQSKFIRGDLGFVSPGRLESSMQDAVRQLHPGEISGVVVSPDGYRILQLVDFYPENGKNWLHLRQIYIKPPQSLDEIIRSEESDASVYVFVKL